MALLLFALLLFFPGKGRSEENAQEIVIVKKLVGIFYYNQTFGSVHKHASVYSTVLTTISCGHPVKVFELSTGVKQGWSLVTAGAHEGYILEGFLSPKRPSCLQKKYKEFFKTLELDLSELYYWGRLYDQYLLGKSKVK